jgi:hypothetical protein
LNISVACLLAELYPSHRPSHVLSLKCYENIISTFGHRFFMYDAMNIYFASTLEVLARFLSMKERESDPDVIHIESSALSDYASSPREFLLVRNSRLS